MRHGPPPSCPHTLLPSCPYALVSACPHAPVPSLSPRSRPPAFLPYSPHVLLPPRPCGFTFPCPHALQASIPPPHPGCSAGAVQNGVGKRVQEPVRGLCALEQGRGACALLSITQCHGRRPASRWCRDRGRDTGSDGAGTGTGVVAQQGQGTLWCRATMPSPVPGRIPAQVQGTCGAGSRLAESHTQRSNFMLKLSP